jgi:hypothetical protein
MGLRGALRPLLLAPIHRSAWKKNSRKFTVASSLANAAASTRVWRGAAPSASKCGD